MAPKNHKKNRAAHISYGNPAISFRPVAFRPWLAAGLALSVFLIKNYMLKKF
jgi:hypothetical protein